MNRVLNLVLISLALLAALVVVGCKESTPLSELERFVERTEALEGKALDDTLRALSIGDGPYSLYARYMIGNRFYEAANDSALMVGWDNEGVAALMDSAEVHFTHCVEQDSTFIEALVNLGSLWDDRSQGMSTRTLRDQNLDKARGYYEAALAIDPTDEKALCNLGSLHLNQRKTGDAIAAFQKVLEFNPDSALAHYNLAIMFAEAKIYREAIDEFEAAAESDPNGDIGERARDNVQIIKDLMNAPDPALK